MSASQVNIFISVAILYIRPVANLAKYKIIVCDNFVNRTNPEKWYHKELPNFPEINITKITLQK